MKKRLLCGVVGLCLLLSGCGMTVNDPTIPDERISVEYHQYDVKIDSSKKDSDGYQDLDDVLETPTGVIFLTNGTDNVNITVRVYENGEFMDNGEVSLKPYQSIGMMKMSPKAEYTFKVKSDAADGTVVKFDVQM